MMELTTVDLYRHALDDEAMWTTKVLQTEPGTWDFTFALEKIVRQRLLQAFLLTVPMDKVLHDGEGCTPEYKTYLEIVNC